MRKSTLFISSVLTTAMLVMLFGVVSAYQTITNVNPVNTATAAPVATEQQQVPDVSSNVNPAPLALPATQAPAVLTAQDAAQLAAKVIGRTDLYSVETSKLNDVDAFLVTFSSGDLVYVSMTGQILFITRKSQTVSTSSNSGGGGGGGGGGRRIKNGGGGTPQGEAGDGGGEGGEGG